MLSTRHGDDRVALRVGAAVEQPQATRMLSGITDTSKNNAIRQIKPDSIFSACITVDICREHTINSCIACGWCAREHSIPPLSVVRVTFGLEIHSVKAPAHN